MTDKRVPFFPMLIVFVAWVAATLGIAQLMTAGTETTLEDLVTKGIAVGILVAMLITLVAVAFWRAWRETGFTRLGEKPMWFLVIVPALLIGVLLMRAILVPSFPLSVVLLVMINTFFVGVSEETMMRGLFFSGVKNRFSFWPAVIATSLTFGAVHALNGFITGEFGMAVVQAGLATLSGTMFLAIRLGMGSIIPAIILHFLWDFSVFLNPQSSFGKNSLLDLAMAAAVVGPVIFGVIGIIALFKIRKRMISSGS